MYKISVKILAVALCLCASSFMNNTMAQPYYNEDDKEGLRDFLRQPSAVTGLTNAEQLGLTFFDTLDWLTNEVWAAKVVGLRWSTDIPKRLTQIDWMVKGVAGTLDAGKWSKLILLNCSVNRLSELDVSKNAALMELYCFETSLNELDVSMNTALWALNCSKNLLSKLDISKKCGVSEIIV